ncbi:MAG: hypothetical protein R3B70_24995 [Polyangiaceae bacterium]
MDRRKRTLAVRGKLALSLPLLAAGLLAISGCDGDGGGTSGGSAGSGGTSGSGGAGGTGGSGGAAECTPPPSEIASVQKVKVTLTNTASSDRFLVTDCHDCDVLLVEQKTEIDYTPLPLRISAADACGCECPNPGDPYAAGFRRIAPGESFEAVWDARALSTCTASIDCGEGFTAKVKSGALQPVDAGEYRVSFGFVETLPPECEEDPSGVSTCGPPANPGLDLGGGFYPVNVTLPATGDVTATLDVP